MFQAMKDYWWLLLLRGIVAVLFGVFTLVYPGDSAVSLVLAFGSLAVVYGGIAVALALFGNGSSDVRFMLGLQGVVQALLGVLVLTWPGITMLSLLWAIITFAFVGGIIEIVAAFVYRDFWLGLSGVVGVLFGIYGFRFPADGALAIVYTIGFYAIFIGVMYVIGSFQVRRVGNELEPSTVKAV
jgi:uncharacterized membrane protein HdeD (DUF308 family)